MKTTKTTSSFLLLLIFFIILILICLNTIFPPSPSPTPTPLGPKKIFKPSDLFAKELWQKSGEVYVDEDPPMVLVANKIIVGFSFDQKITAFASRTGNALWNASFEGSLWSISVDAEAVYAATKGIEAYNLDTGQSMWRNEKAQVRRHGGHWLDATPSSLNYYFHQNVTTSRIYNAFSRLDKLSGQVQDRFVEERDVYFRQDEIKYTFERNQNQLSAIDTTNNQVLWTLDINGYPQRLPIVLDQVMYFITKEPDLKSRKRSIYAINLPTGDVRWSIQKKILSNIAVGQDSIFAISDEGNILAWDIHTAEPIGEILITPSIQPDRKYQNRYSVNANDQFLVAYYGDSQQLVVFERVDNIYNYDNLYRLTSATYSTGQSYEYEYDPVGNRLQQIIDGDTTDYLYDAANRLTSVDGQAYTFDANGNLLTTGAMTNTWDAANRLINSTNSTNSLTPIYNGVNDRVGQTVGTTTTNFALDVAGGLPEVIYTSEGNAYLHLPGVIVAESSTGEVRYLLSDGLGSVRQAVDDNAEVVAYQEYDPYGNPTQNSTLKTQNYGFTGEWWEDDVELLHLRARWYAPETGTFLSRDAWEGLPYAPTTMNGYNYVYQNPINFNDPTGLWGDPITKATEECLKMSPCRELVFVVAEEGGTATAVAVIGLPAGTVAVLVAVPAG